MKSCAAVVGTLSLIEILKNRLNSAADVATDVETMSGGMTDMLK